jgi:hypothetical protein
MKLGRFQISLYNRKKRRSEGPGGLEGRAFERLLVMNKTNTYHCRLLRGANGGTYSEQNPTNKRRDLALLACLIEHPDVGLILYETGCAEDVDVVNVSGDVLLPCIKPLRRGVVVDSHHVTLIP